MATRLPDEVVEEILVRLPAKSLMRFKSVQRWWNALTKSKRFVKRHSEKQKERRSGVEQFMMWDLYPWEEGLDLEEGFNRISIVKKNEVVEELPPAQHPLGRRSHCRDVWMNDMEQCNGVVLIDCDGNDPERDYILWNPATREVKFVHPPSPVIDSPEKLLCRGFGACDSEHDSNATVFKIIRLYRSPVVGAEIYNSSSNSWSWLPQDQVDALANYCQGNQPRSSALVNGIYYWFFPDLPINSILSFHFYSNQFQFLDAPSSAPPIKSHADLAPVAGGHSLAYCHYLASDVADYSTQIPVWILNQQDSTWTKIAHIQALPHGYAITGIWNDFAGFLAHCRTYDSDDDESLVSFDFDGHPLWQCKVRHFSHFYVYMVPYEESIAPISL